MKLSLMVTEGAHAGQVIPVGGVRLLVGRGPQCHIRPNSPAVAERHCNLTIRGERAFVRDLDSPGGTFLNDRQLRGEIELRDGDFLRVGPLVFVIQLEALAGAPAAAGPGPRCAAETQAYVPEPLPPAAAETQEMPALEPEPLPLPPEDPALAAVGSAAPLPMRNGSWSARATWGGPRRRSRPHT